MAISPHTPPGTEVVCVKLVDNHVSRLPPLEIGRLYVVDRIVKNVCGDYGVIVRGIDHKAVYQTYSRRYFSLPILPSCLTDCLNTAPAPNERVRA